MNRVILMGNLTRDPEVRQLNDGHVGKFGMAVNRKWRTKGGEDREEATFVEVEAWGRMAEVIGEHFAKGRPILVEGRLKMDEWADKATGERRSRLMVSCERFEFIGGKDPSEGSNAAQGDQRDVRPNRQPRRKPATTGAGGHPEIDPSSIPF